MTEPLAEPRDIRAYLTISEYLALRLCISEKIDDEGTISDDLRSARQTLILGFRRRDERRETARFRAQKRAEMAARG